MDYQCVVVYTIISIPPPGGASCTGPPPPVRRVGGCLAWLKANIKRGLAAYLKFLNISPSSAVQFGNLASMYYDNGLIDQCIEAYRRAINLQPNYPDAYCNLANALKEKGLVEDAVECYLTALEHCPTHADSVNNLANVQRELGFIKEATRLYYRALELFPNFAVAHNNLGSILQNQGNTNGALRHYREAVRINPDFADAYSNMGNTFKDTGDINMALKCYERAIEINPKFADAHNNLASMLKDCGRLHEAIASYKIALLLNPNFSDAFYNLLMCSISICDWSNYTDKVTKLVEIVNQQLHQGRLPSVPPHHAMLYPLTHENRKRIAASNGQLCEIKAKRFEKHYQFSTDLNGDRLRIGYVSSDFRNHPTSHLMQSIPGFHDRSNVEIFCYSISPNDSTNFRQKIKEGAEHFKDVSNEPSDRIADIIHADNIQILVNMNGYTEGARNEIFALRPAPIQVLWLGYPGTSGTRFIDYLITDKTISPIDHADNYTENLAYMPDTYFVGDHRQMFPHLSNRVIITENIRKARDNVCILNAMDLNKVNQAIPIRVCRSINLNVSRIILFTRLADSPVLIHLLDNINSQVTIKDLVFENGVKKSQNTKVATGEEVPQNVIVTSREQYNLPKDAVVFCNFNQFYKIDPLIFKLWINIILSVPNSVLWLLRFPIAGEINILHNAETLGLAPERIIFSDVSCKEEHLRRAQLADVCLDTFVCTGHTTSMDLLWAGTPIVTLPGETFASRVTASLLNALGCPELIAQNAEQFQNMAINLGNNRNLLKAIRSKIWILRNQSPLFDTRLYTRNLENLYRRMWQRHSAGLPADHLL